MEITSPYFLQAAGRAGKGSKYDVCIQASTQAAIATICDDADAQNAMRIWGNLYIQPATTLITCKGETYGELKESIGANALSMTGNIDDEVFLQFSDDYPANIDLSSFDQVFILRAKGREFNFDDGNGGGTTNLEVRASVDDLLENGITIGLLDGYIANNEEAATTFLINLPELEAGNDCVIIISSEATEAAAITSAAEAKNWTVEE